MESTSERTKSRKKLIPLLEKLLNEGNIPQLVWVDKESRIWRMPWKHHAPTHWGDPDAYMLTELAKIFYDYKGPEEPAQDDLKLWKGRLRNNLTALKNDVKELGEMHVTRGDNPYKVYQFVSNEARRSRPGRHHCLCEFQGLNSECGQQGKQEAIHSSSRSTSRSGDGSDFFDNSQDLWFPQIPSAAEHPRESASCEIADISTSRIRSFQGDHSNAGLCFGNSHYTNALPDRFPQDDLLTECFLNIDAPTNHRLSNFGAGVNYNILNDVEAGLNATHNNLPSSSSYIPFRSRSPLACDMTTSVTTCTDHAGSFPDKVYFSNNTTLQVDPAANFGAGINHKVKNDVVSGLDVTDCNLHWNSNSITFRSRSVSARDVTTPVVTSTGHASSFPDVTGSRIYYFPMNIKIQDEPAVSYSITPNKSPYELNSDLRGMCLPASTCIADDSCDTGLGFNAAADAIDKAVPAIADCTFQKLEDMMLLHDFSQHNYLGLSRVPRARPQVSLGLEVKYYNFRAMQPRIMPCKFRICFLADEHVKESIMSCPTQQIGPKDVHLLELPLTDECQRLSTKQTGNIKKVLNNLKGGVIVDFRDDNIYATRYSKAVPLCSIPGVTEWQKLERLQEVKIYDFHDNFKRLFIPQSHYQTVKPFVQLSFAVKDPNKKIPAVTVDIWHIEALLMTQQAEEETSSSLEPDCSLSNEFDRILSLEDMLKKSCPNL